MKTITLTDQQISAVEMVKKNQISLLSGGPGTGKTTTVLEIVNWAKTENLKVLMAAPTGKAAKRMQETTGEEATTIHAMLGCTFDNNRFEFIHNEEKPLNADLVILDETSMITTSLMSSVMDAIDATSTKLLMVGDPYQLPSVGAGAVLRDFLESDIFPHVELDIVQRNSGRIVEVCHGIKNGKTYFPDSKFDLDAESPINLIHIESMTPESTQQAVKAIICERMPLRGYDPEEDIMVLSPVNVKGSLSCLALNKVLRQELNPDPNNPQNNIDDPEDGNQRMAFRPGDKVIQCKNEKVETINKKNNGKKSVTLIVNGDIGNIVAIDKDGKTPVIIVDFTAPDRRVVIPLNDNNLLHAYAITCHRAQGSEAPVVIIPVHHQFNYFLSNSWLYTAISRGKELVITIGAFETINKAIHNRIPNNRITRLKQRFVEYDRRIIEAEFAEL